MMDTVDVNDIILLDDRLYQVAVVTAKTVQVAEVEAAGAHKSREPPTGHKAYRLDEGARLRRRSLERVLREGCNYEAQPPLYQSLLE